jgi:hypothetical protein
MSVYEKIIAQYGAVPFFQETSSLSAQINSATYIAEHPLVCAIHDGCIINKIDTDIIDAVFRECPDDVFMLLGRQEEGNSTKMFPIISRRAIELLGYFFFPLFTSRKYCVDWIASIFFDVQRFMYTDAFSFELNEKGTKMVEDPELVHLSRDLFNTTGQVRRLTAGSLSGFIQKGA